jgi:glycine oxidase
MSDAAPAPDIAVLGGGIAGLSIAWRLLRRGLAVTVVAGQQPSASTIAAGMLAPMPEIGLNPALGRLASAGLRAYPEFLDALAEDTDLRTGFEGSGLLRVAYGAEDAEVLREQVGTYEAAGMPSRWLDARACLAEVPGLGGAGLSGGLLSYDEAQVQPEWLLAALRDAIRRRGGVVVEAQAADVSPHGGRVTVTLEVAGLRQQLEAGKAVLALGSWSGAIPGVVLPVRPVKGQLLAFAGRPGPSRIVYWGHDYLLAKPDGSVILGATMEEAGFSLVPDERAQDLRHVLQRLWPALVEAPAIARAGLRPASPDGMPLTGWLPGGDLYAFTAHFRNGFLLAPLAGRLAANEIADGRQEEMLTSLRPDRFEKSGVEHRLGRPPGPPTL